MTEHYEGGYVLTPKASIFMTKLMERVHTKADPDAISDRHLTALNRVQSTPFDINRFILGVAKEAVDTGNTLRDLIPNLEAIPMPDPIDPDIWEKMDNEDRQVIKAQRAKIYAENCSRIGRNIQFLQKMTIAPRMAKYDRHWYPHAFDFRFRMYPIPTDLNPQSDDFGRALLRFAEGKTLGSTGIYWLAVRIATTAGQDKLSFDDRMMWTLENHEWIVSTGKDPFMDLSWTEVDEPWSFLAGCREWYEAYQLQDPADFVSHLPVPMDGSINGCQHLSLLGLDPVGAFATNCTSHPERQDLYVEVQQEVMRLVSEDAAAGEPLAQEWVGNITRKTVKRAVMTTPYGVTERGISKQLLSDRMTPEDAESAARSADYLQKKITQALETVVSKGKELMAYFQGVAKALADHNVPMQWTIPTGSRVTQSYYHDESIKIRTLVGRFKYNSDTSGTLNPRKNALASAPNVIHSLDAAMLAEVVNRLWEDHGIRDFHMIHDSYAVHARDTTIMNAVIRRVAYDQYSDDWLSQFHNEQLERAPDGCELPTPPERGDFDLREVLESRFFFS